MNRDPLNAARDRVAFAAARIAALMRARISRCTALPASDWRLLGLLAEAVRLGVRLQTQAELGAALSLSPSAFTRLIDRMVRKGYVRRQPGASRRTRIVVLSPRGAAQWRRLRRRIQSEFADMFSSISARDMRVADRVLARLRAYLETTVL